ncbi:MAG: acyl-CoA thioesterase [Sedimentibacter sp.]|uniref:acyl-CoA thioesterase n=1 Tax=Sedimentibacter sp. TaxID=1960295 RepID=UPI002981BAAB|nr:acyl-CoA thioesterase [Sedimentibacter sp.]MDW5300361.1 acyl-CoA thioesterase [Sedimentibacter sp.]
MQPEHANIAGNVHGGEIMKMMDNAAGIAAARHSRSNVVTARVDGLEFHLPIHIGNYVKCICQLTFVGKSSMEVLVTVMVEDMKLDEAPKVALTGYFTFVAIVDNGKPISVPQLLLSNEGEEKLYEEGKKRYLKYKESKLKKLCTEA